MKVYLGGKQLSLSPSTVIGKGGEADIFDIGGGLVVKIFKQPSHPDFNGFPQEQSAAQDRIQEHQNKLPAFPKNLPVRVIVPIDLVKNSKGVIQGYSMKFLKGYEVLLKYSDRKFRQAGINNNDVVQTFKDLHNTVDGIHKAGVVIGDFNDLNVMVNNNEANIIDADSFQFGPFYCRVFTEKFVDPMLCDINNTIPVLVRPHTQESDWYAFAVMLMQSLLFVGPYGGVYSPKDPANRVNHVTRPLKRITVFNQEVKYPKPAVHFSVLSDELLQYFHQLFIEDKRGIFPNKLLEDLRWTECTKCGTTHAKKVCPSCSTFVQSLIKETVRGNVTCTYIFQTSGLILTALASDSGLKYLYHENGEFKREGDISVVRGNVGTTMRFRIRGKETLIGDGGQFITLVPGRKPEKTVVDCFGSLPLFDTNEHNKYWLYDGTLLRDDYLGQKFIGNVLKGQTLFWVGQQFGFGFYRAGNIHTGFVFDANSGCINDNINLPLIPGQLIDATCYFAGNWVWFLTTIREKGQTINRCLIVKSDGTIKEYVEAKDGDGSWLGSIRGKCAAGNFLLSATDEGIVKVEPVGGSISITKEFPDTEPFVDSGCHLYPDKNGIYVVDRNTIKMLQIR